MKQQLSFPLEMPTIETVARAFAEDNIYFMAQCQVLPEYVADHAIKLRRQANAI